eukprot:317696-Prymnesium_polylepis.1
MRSSSVPCAQRARSTAAAEIRLGSCDLAGAWRVDGSGRERSRGTPHPTRGGRALRLNRARRASSVPCEGEVCRRAVRGWVCSRARVKSAAVRCEGGSVAVRCEGEFCRRAKVGWEPAGSHLLVGIVASDEDVVAHVAGEAARDARLDDAAHLVAGAGGCGGKRQLRRGC